MPFSIDFKGCFSEEVDFVARQTNKMGPTSNRKVNGVISFIVTGLLCNS